MLVPSSYHRCTGTKTYKCSHPTFDILNTQAHVRGSGTASPKRPQIRAGAPLKTGFNKTAPRARKGELNNSKGSRLGRPFLPIDRPLLSGVLRAAKPKKAQQPQTPLLAKPTPASGAPGFRGPSRIRADIDYSAKS